MLARETAISYGTEVQLWGKSNLGNYLSRAISRTSVKITMGIIASIA